MQMPYGPYGHLHHFLRETPDIFGWLYSELYLGRFQTDGIKNRTLIEKVFVGKITRYHSNRGVSAVSKVCRRSGDRGAAIKV